MRALALVVSALALALSTPATVDAQTPRAPESIADPLVVKGANRARTLDYVRAVTELSPSGQVSKRPNQLCPLVAGAQPEINRYVLARLREVANEVGVHFATRSCQPDLLVLFSREPEEMLRKARARGKIRYDDISIPRVDRFRANAYPVRWLSRTMEVPIQGQADGGFTDAAFVTFQAPGSRIVQPVASVLYHSMVVVDARKADGVPVAALADYVSFVALANIKVGAVQSSYDSILELFAAPGSSKRLSNADKAYLRAVYKVRSHIGASDQLAPLATAMVDELQR